MIGEMHSNKKALLSKHLTQGLLAFRVGAADRELVRVCKSHTLKIAGEQDFRQGVLDCILY